MSKRSFLDNTFVAGSTITIDTISNVTGDIIGSQCVAAEVSFDTNLYAGTLTTRASDAIEISVMSISYADFILGSDGISEEVTLDRLAVLSSFGGPPRRIVVNSMSTDAIDAVYTSATSLRCIGVNTAVTISNVASISFLRSFRLESSLTEVIYSSVTTLRAAAATEFTVSTLSAGSVGSAPYTIIFGTTTSLTTDVSTLSAVFTTLMNFQSTDTQIIDASTAISTFTAKVDGTYEIMGLISVLAGDGNNYPQFLRYVAQDNFSLDLYINDVLSRQLAAQNYYASVTSVTVQTPVFHICTLSANDYCYIKCNLFRNTGLAIARAYAHQTYPGTRSQISFIRLGPK